MCESSCQSQNTKAIQKNGFSRPLSLIAYSCIRISLYRKHIAHDPTRDNLYFISIQTSTYTLTPLLALKCLLSRGVNGKLLKILAWHILWMQYGEQIFGNKAAAGDCAEEEMTQIWQAHNETPFMKGILIRRDGRSSLHA